MGRSACRAEVRERLQLAAGRGKTIFVSTHLLDMAERLCARVGIINAGRLVEVGDVETLRRTLAPGGSLEEIFIKVTEPDDSEET